MPSSSDIDNHRVAIITLYLYEHQAPRAGAGVSFLGVGDAWSRPDKTGGTGGAGPARALRQGTMKKIPRMVPMAEIMKKLANMKKLMVAIRSGANLTLGYPTLPSSCPRKRM
jgi:hypothetical protein